MVPPPLLLGGAALLLWLMSSKDKNGSSQSPNPPGGVEDRPFEQCLDTAMPPAMKGQVVAILSQVIDPSQLDAAAQWATAGGFPKAAACLKARADDLRRQAPSPNQPPAPQPSDPIPPPPGQPDPSPDHSGNMPFVVRYGDYPYGLAQYYTGQGSRFKELESVNSNLGPWKTFHGKSGDYQGYSNWQPGLNIVLPASWGPYSKPLPNPGQTTSSSTMPGIGMSAH